MAPGATAPYGNTYAVGHAAHGSVHHGYLVIKVPTAQVGRPTPGSTLVSVGSYSLLGPTDALATVATSPITVDETPTFDYRLPPAPKGMHTLASIPATPVISVVDRSWWSGGVPDLARLAGVVRRAFAGVVPAPTSALAGNTR